MKRRLISFIRQRYRALFGYELSDQVVVFLKNFSFSAWGFVISSGIFFAVNVLAGRYLGPVEYGKYNLVISLGSVFAALSYFGIEATTVKYVSIAQTDKRRSGYITNSFTSLAVTSLLVVILTLALKGYFSSLLHTNRGIILVALIYGIIFAYKTILENVIRSFGKFLVQSKVKVMESVIVMVLVLSAFLLLRERSSYWYIASTVLAMLVVVAIYFRRVSKFFGHFDRNLFKQTVPYQKLALLSSVSSIAIATFDKFVVARFLGIAQLGLYSAYLISSVVIVGQVVSSLTNVFFPTVNRMQDKKGLMKKVDRLVVASSVPLLVFFSALTFVVLKIFGHSYEINLIHLSLVAFISLLQIAVGFYGPIISSSEKYFRSNTKIQLVKPFVLAALYWIDYRLGHISITTMLMIMAFSYLYDILNCKLNVRYT